MGVVLKIFSEQRLVYNEFYGEVSEREFLEHSRTIASDPRFDPAYSEIVDLSRVTKFDISEKALNQQAASKSIFLPESKHAVIAPAVPVYEAARMFQTQANSRILAVVQTREQACAFLGIDSVPE